LRQQGSRIVGRAGNQPVDNGDFRVGVFARLISGDGDNPRDQATICRLWPPGEGTRLEAANVPEPTTPRPGDFAGGADCQQED
jgi:hypothetical protein